MNLDTKQIIPIIKLLLKKFRKYIALSFIVITLLLYSFLVLQINSLSASDPDEEAVAAELTAKRLKIDQNSVDKLEELEDQNIGVQALFETARDNPFQD